MLPILPGPLERVFNGIGKVLEGADRDALLGRVLGAAVRLSHFRDHNLVDLLRFERELLTSCWLWSRFFSRDFELRSWPKQKPLFSWNNHFNANRRFKTKNLSVTKDDQRKMRDSDKTGSNQKRICNIPVCLVKCWKNYNSLPPSTWVFPLVPSVPDSRRGLL